VQGMLITQTCLFGGGDKNWGWLLHACDYVYEEFRVIGLCPEVRYFSSMG